MRQTPISLVLLLILGWGGLALGWFLVTNPEVVLPLTVEALLLGIITAAILSREPDERVRRGLVRVVLLAVGARVLAMYLVQGVLNPSFFAPDYLGYERAGQQLAAFWRGLGPDPEKGQRFQLYPYLSGLFSYALGSSNMAAVVLNIFAGTWTCIVTFYLGRRLLSEEVGWYAAVMAAVFPSLILWSVLHIRDAITTLVVVTTSLVAVLAVQSRRRGVILAYAGLVFILWSLRDYMAFLVVAGTAVGAFASARPGRVGRSLALGILFVVAAVFLAERAGLLIKFQEGETLATAQAIRAGMALEAGSAFGTTLDTSTLAGALRYLPTGMVIILLAPFPWAITSSLQLFSLPEVLAWYLLVPLLVPGIRLAFREGSRLQLITLAVVLVVVCTYALVEGNVGTAYRHRAQIMPLAFLYVGTGFIRAKAVLARLRQERITLHRPARRRTRPQPGRAS